MQWYNTSVQLSSGSKDIPVIFDTTEASHYVVDARKLLQPWLAVQGVRPRAPAIIPRAPQTIALREIARESEEREPFGEVFFTLASHPLQWYRYFRAARLAPPVGESPATPRTPWKLPSFRLPEITVPEIRVRRFRPTGTQKAVASFALAAFALVTPLQSLPSFSLFKTQQTVAQQLADIQTQLRAGASPGAITPSLFELASTFQDVEKKLGIGNEIIKLAVFAPIPLGKLQSNAALFEAGLAVSNAVITLRDTLASLPKDATTADKAKEFLQTAESIEPNLEQVEKSLARLRPNDVPEEARAHLPAIQKLVTAVHRDLQTITETTEGLLALLGNKKPARFLVLFQNDEELRATGGFIGSFGLLDVENGAIKKFEVPGTGAYAVQGQLTAYLRAPEPLHTVNTRFEFQDSNWFPDFPASAETAMRLYELSHGATVDGVIAVNTAVLEGLLEVLGSVNTAGGTTLGRDNAIGAIYADIQKNKAAGLPPKQLISALAPTLTNMLGALTPQQTLGLIQLFNTARNQKDILVFAEDAATQQQLRALAWDGAVPLLPNTEDDLQVIHSNIGGGKTDAFIKQKIIQRVDIQSDGYVKKQLTIVRTHTGASDASATNRDYLRVYVPEGSTLIAASGFSQPPETIFHAPETWYDEHPLVHAADATATFDERTGVKIYREFGKTVFGNWVLTAPGETSTIQLDYLLPKRLFEPAAFRRGIIKRRPSCSYQLTAAKQPGDHDTELITTIALPANWEPIWLTDPTMELGKELIVHRTIFDTDKLVGLVAAHN